MPYKDYSVKVNCPVTNRIETAYFISTAAGVCVFNGCDSMSGAPACKRCKTVECEKFKAAHPDFLIY